MLPRVYMEFGVREGARGELKLGRVVLELRADVAPRTAENFRCLCVGWGGAGGGGAAPLSFGGSRVHRIIPGFMVQGGDITRGDGTGGMSVYGAEFEDETFALSHEAAGVLSMANAGADTNNSQFFITLKACRHLDGKHVVFGRVVEGMHVLKKLEKLGSRSGDVAADVRVIDCGEEGVLAGQEDALAATISVASAPRAAGGDDGGRARAHAGARPAPADGGTAPGSPGAGGAEVPPPGAAEAEAGGVPVPDPTAGMSAREKRMYEIRRKMEKSKTANRRAVAAERRREANGGAAGEDEGGESSARQYKEAKQREKETLEAHGLGEDRAHLLDSLEAAERAYKKKNKKPAISGPDPFSQQNLYRSFQRRADAVPVDLEEYERAKREAPEFYRDGNSMMYGQAPEIPEKNVDRMVKELDEQRERREKFSRRRKHYEGRDVDSINNFNAQFNRKAGRAFDDYTAEIKMNLERGTALPER